MDVLKRYLKHQWDRVGAWLCIAAGALALLVGYLGVSATPETWKQIPYVVSGGMVGLFLLGLGALLWLSADLRDEWRKLDAIDRHLLEAGVLPTREVPAQRDGSAEDTPETLVLVERQELSLR